MMHPDLRHDLGRKQYGGIKMTDFITIVIAILAIVLIMKIAAKLLKFVLTMVVIGIVLYVLANYGFLSGLF